jgi:hypothetical protein
LGNGRRLALVAASKLGGAGGIPERAWCHANSSPRPGKQSARHAAACEVALAAHKSIKNAG